MQGGAPRPSGTAGYTPGSSWSSLHPPRSSPPAPWAQCRESWARSCPVAGSWLPQVWVGLLVRCRGRGGGGRVEGWPAGGGPAGRGGAGWRVAERGVVGGGRGRRWPQEGRRGRRSQEGGTARLGGGGPSEVPPSSSPDIGGTEGCHLISSNQPTISSHPRTLA